MPIKSCQINGKDGWKYGDTGTCYPGPEGKKKAIAQGVAITGGDFPKNEGLERLERFRDFFAVKKIGWDFDGTLSTTRGQNLFKSLTGTMYVITARNHQSPDVFKITDRLGVPRSRVFFTGSNQNKVEKIKSLGLDLFYDNNPSVHSLLPSIVRNF